MDALRVFIAVDTPPEVKARMGLLRDALAGGTRGVRWEAEGKLHCTLRFLGDIERPRLASIEEAVAGAAAGIPPLSLIYSGIGFFPDERRPRVIWVGIRDSDGALGRLHERLSRELSGLGFPPEERPFHPHVTLGRIGDIPRGRVLIEIVETRTFEHPPVIVPAVEVMQSVLSARGSEYRILRSIPLAGGEAGGTGLPGSVPGRS